LNVSKIFEVMREDEKMVQDVESLIRRLGSSEDFDDSAVWRC
jgi:hypothetical protein